MPHRVIQRTRQRHAAEPAGHVGTKESPRWAPWLLTAAHSRSHRPHGRLRRRRRCRAPGRR
jgi:hypothetical protein